MPNIYKSKYVYIKRFLHYFRTNKQKVPYKSSTFGAWNTPSHLMASISNYTNC